MSSTIAPPLPAARTSRANPGAHAQQAIRPWRLRRGDRDSAALARYLDRAGRAREVVARAGFEGSVLVIDRDVATLADLRLVAHLGADEPRENAALVCASYLDHVRRGGCRCRSVTQEDFHTAPFVGGDEDPPVEREPLDQQGRAYRLEALHTAMSIPELRWRRQSPGPGGAPDTVSAREAIAALESYEPIRALSKQALARAGRTLSTAVLRAELTRVEQSPIVLNRRLREVTVSLLQRERLTLSEIAVRCGRVKRDGCGGKCGETSWLARRIGLLPEGGRDAPTPWIHSKTLGLIARRGLGLSPREVEVD
jgi:hypothetical protein